MNEDLATEVLKTLFINWYYWIIPLFLIIFFIMEKKLIKSFVEENGSFYDFIIMNLLILVFSSFLTLMGTFIISFLSVILVDLFSLGFEIWIDIFKIILFMVLIAAVFIGFKKLLWNVFVLKGRQKNKEGK